MHTKKRYRRGHLIFLGALAIILAGCCPPFCGTPPPEPYNCSGYGTYGAFVATFDADTVGSLPTTTSYGPPGADLEIENGANTVEVVDSAILGSKALKITRPNGFNPTVVKGVAGDLGQGPYTSGKYYINFTAHGEVVPEHLIAGIAIAVLSTEDNMALNLKLFDGSYHLSEGGNYNRLSGSYNPGASHKVHIKLDMDERKYSICIDGEAVASNNNFTDNSFSNVSKVRFFAPATVTEAFPMTYIVDDIRILK